MSQMSEKCQCGIRPDRRLSGPEGGSDGDLGWSNGYLIGSEGYLA